MEKDLILFIEETDYNIMVGFKKNIDDDKFFILKQCSNSNQRDVKLLRSYAYQLKNYLSMPLTEIKEGKE